MERKAYKTLLRPGEAEFIIHKSRFLGAGMPVETEEEALAFLAARRAAHPGANHACYAYLVGANMGIMRYSDDGEPGGTAGLPIIEVLKARGVTNCCVVVTRYFGGILLGAGGLTRAYAKGAAEAVTACGIGIMWPTTRLILEVSYPILGRFEYFLEREPIVVEDKTFAESITFTLLVRTRDYANLAQDITECTGGSVVPLPMEEVFLPWADEENPDC